MLSFKSRLGKAWTKSTGEELGNITIMWYVRTNYSPDTE
jgi:hypothetical protein